MKKPKSQAWVAHGPNGSETSLNGSVSPLNHQVLRHGGTQSLPCLVSLLLGDWQALSLLHSGGPLVFQGTNLQIDY
jgi:hypothetical protein